MIVPFAAGGSSDVIARLIAEQMSGPLGQRIIIENVVGAGGSTALTRAARATADGYTIAIGNSGTNTAVYTLYPDVKFTADDFVPLGLVAKTSPIIAIKKDHPAKTLREFLDYVKKNPGKVDARPRRRRLVELSDLQSLRAGGGHRRDAGRLSRRRAGAERSDRRTDRRRVRLRGVGRAVDPGRAHQRHCAGDAAAAAQPARTCRRRSRPACRNFSCRAGTRCSRPRARPSR